MNYEALGPDYAFCVEVKVRDTGGLTNSVGCSTPGCSSVSYGAFMITVTDVNETPVIPSNQKFTVTEDVAVNTKGMGGGEEKGERREVNECIVILCCVLSCDVL